ncbi:MAG: FecR family protein [Bacteroidales bacterium]
MGDNFKKDDLLLKCLQGKADEQEYETAYKWITSDKSNYAYYERIRDAWIAAGIVTNNNEHNCNKAWRKIARRTGVRWFNTSGITSGFRNIAAVFLIALTLGAFSVHYYYSQKEIFTERDIMVKAPLGAKTYLKLPDSTKVWLNAGSTLKYSTHYDITGRSVQLTGEAYFDVVSNIDLPFRVHAHDLVINALGTEFNVKAYPEEKHVETTLVSGVVSLEKNVPGEDVERVILRPNQRAYSSHRETKIGVPDLPDLSDLTDADENINETDEKISVMPVRPLEKIAVEKVVNTEVYTSWKDKRLLFDREKMADLAVKLERIYDVEITFKDDELKDYYLSGSLEQETLEQLLYAIRLTIPLDFSIEKNNVVLTMNHHLKEKYNNLSN